jgi:hypothetical protein
MPPLSRARRIRWVSRVEQRLLRRSSPRLFMSLLVAITAASAFFASAAMLGLGLRWMSLRYGLAVLVSYGVFILLISVWLMQRRRIGRGLSDVNGPFGEVQSAPARGGAGADTGGSLDVGMDEGLVLLVFLLAVACATLAASYVIFTAPSLLAELLLDGVVSAGLYRRLRRIERRHWLDTVLRRTRLPFLITAAFFTLLGGAFQLYAPEARAIGGVLEKFGGPEVADE